MSSKSPVIVSILSALLLLIELLVFGLMLFHAMMANAGWEGSTVAGYERLYWISPILGIACVVIVLAYASIGKRSIALKWWAGSVGIFILGALIVSIVENLPVARGY